MSQPDDEFPNDLGELDSAISEAMVDAAKRATRDAELYALDRSLDPPTDPEDFPKWSEISQPGTDEAGPFWRPWRGEDPPPVSWPI
jgi:hypothetical protein